jgi:pimeloyl-ACP methyl ester carboxylesterase
MLGGQQQTEILEGHASQALVDWAARDPKLWVVAIEALVQADQTEAAAWATDHLKAAAPQVRYFQSMGLLLKAAPGRTGDRTFDEFRDDPSADVQTVQRAGAQGVLLVFTGVGGRAGMPLSIIHRWFGACSLHVIYLRDFKRQAYNHGIIGLGPDYGQTLNHLSAAVDALNTSNIFVYGNSVGGYAALRYGLDLRATSILVFSAVSSLAPPVLPKEELLRRGLRAGPDLKPFFLAASLRLNTYMVFGAECVLDAAHAHRMSDVPGVHLEALPNCKAHESVQMAVEQGRFGAIIQENLRCSQGW